VPRFEEVTDKSETCRGLVGDIFCSRLVGDHIQVSDKIDVMEFGFTQQIHTKLKLQ